jgi:hypothetical protein
MKLKNFIKLTIKGYKKLFNLFICTTSRAKSTNTYRSSGRRKRRKNRRNRIAKNNIEES